MNDSTRQRRSILIKEENLKRKRRHTLLYRPPGDDHRLAPEGTGRALVPE